MHCNYLTLHVDVVGNKLGPVVGKRMLCSDILTAAMFAKADVTALPFAKTDDKTTCNNNLRGYSSIIVECARCCSLCLYSCVILYNKNFVCSCLCHSCLVHGSQLAILFLDL